MRTALIFLFIGIVLLGLAVWQVDIWFRPSRADILVHDTYLVVDYAVVFGFPLLFLATLFSFGGLIGSRFKSVFFILLFLACLACIGYIVWLFLS